MVQRLLVALVQVLALGVWFSVSAVVPSVQQELGISSGRAVWLTASVQLGFVLGALSSSALNLVDRVPANVVMAVSSILASGTTSLLAIMAHDFRTMVALRFLTGIFLAGVYPAGMKLMASWAPAAGRALWMGVLIGALTMGSALPNLIAGLTELPWRSTLHAAAAIGAVGGVMAAALVRVGPFVSRTPVQLQASYMLRMFAQRRPLLINLGYFGHMWELYALWTWVPVFVIHAPVDLQGHDQVLVFATMGIGGAVGCLVGGWAADRYGRERAAVTALLVSGLCCLLSPLIFVAPAAVLTGLCLVWGASVIADSGVFSTALTETVEPHHVGTALSVQTAVGFSLTVVSIQIVPVLAETVGWQYSMVVLAIGPICGSFSMAALQARPLPDG